ALTGALLALLLFQHYLVSFGISKLPERVVLLKGVEGELSWNWNLYTQTYFGIWGEPRREDWRIEHVLDEVRSAKASTPVRLGLVPDIPRFDFDAFLFYCQLRKAPVRLARVGRFDEAAILDNDFIIASDTQPEHVASSRPDQRINAYLMDHPEKFQLAE